jgi:AcrR family transcriptional regulator
VSPRAYQLGRRQVAADETRVRIVRAAREVLAAPGGFGEFTIDAVARQAGVARMTVFHRLGSKTGLLEALYDDLAHTGLVDRLRASFGRADPAEALDAFIRAFVGFWSSDRVVIRRLRSLAGLDPEVERTIRARDARRKDGLLVLVNRLAGKYGRLPGGTTDQVVDVLSSVTSFEMFDALGGESRTSEEVATILIRVARRLTIADSGSSRRSGRASPR